MARLFTDFAAGELSATASAGAVSLTSDGFADLPTVSGSDYLWIVLDPAGLGNGPEAVKVAAHSASSNTVTCLGLVAEHADTTRWVAPALAEDFERLDPLESTQTSHTSRLNTIEGNAWVTTARINDGAVTEVKLGTGAVSETKLAAGAVSTAKLSAALAGMIPPAGAITAYAGSSAPTGWLLCDGSAVSRTTYADLFAVVGTTYGVGNGATTFNLPNLKGRVPVGRDSGDTDFDALGETGGAKTVTLTEAQLPSHTHGDGTLSAASDGAHTHPIQTQGTASSADHNHAEAGVMTQAGTGFVAATPGATDSGGAHTHDVTGSTGATGSGQAHGNVQPYLVLNYIIRY